MYDERVAGEAERAVQANDELLAACIGLGGSVTGEHGVGVDKAKNLTMQYAEADLNFMHRLRRGVRSRRDHEPGKLLPSHPACGEGSVRRGRCWPPAPGFEAREHPVTVSTRSIAGSWPASSGATA